MTESSSTDQHPDEAREAAQRVADSAESWEHGAEESTVREHLDEGLHEAGVEVPEADKDQLVADIRDEDAKPIVEKATPEDR